MAGPNFSVSYGQEFEFENQEQIDRWLAAGYVEVVGIDDRARNERRDPAADAGRASDASTSSAETDDEDGEPAKQSSDALATTNPPAAGQTPNALASSGSAPGGQAPSTQAAGQRSATKPGPKPGPKPAASSAGSAGRGKQGKKA